MFLWATALAIWGAPRQELEVTASDGSALAEVRRVEENVVATVFALDEAGRRTELWSARTEGQDVSGLYVLTPGGDALVRLLPEPRAGDPLFTLFTSRGAQSYAAPALHVVAFPGRWMSSDTSEAPRLVEEATPWGPRRSLRIALADGSERWLELPGGRVAFAPPPGDVRLDPPAPARQAELEAPYVGALEVDAGAVLDVSVRGELPTPGWSFEGFALEGRRDERGRRVLELVPLARPPAPREISPQVLEPFEASVRVLGLDDGPYTLVVRSRAADAPPPREVEVSRDLDPWLGVHTTGGFAGADRRIAVFRDGWIEWTDLFGRDRQAAPLSPEGREALDRAVDALEATPPGGVRSHTPGAADLFVHHVRLVRDGAMSTWDVDDLAMSEPLKRLLEVLTAPP